MSCGCCINMASNLGASVTARISLPLQDLLRSTWPLLQDFFPQCLDFSTLSAGKNVGFLQLYSYRVSPVPSSDMTTGASEAVHDGSKPCGCLGKDTIANAAAKVAPAVVNIAVPQVFLVIPFGRSRGSGTIINNDGTILTCAHVVLSSLWTRPSSIGKVEVTNLHDGRKFEGKVVDADRHSDIAIVKINSETPLPEAKLGSSSRLRPGDWVIAMGCPLSLKNPVTAGIVSRVDCKHNEFGHRGMPGEYLQTDFAINVGNSGGPLVNIDGEVVGMNFYRVAEGLSFSVPIDSVCKIIKHFKKTRRARRAFHGLTLIELNHMIIAELKKQDVSLPNIHKGILVHMVTCKTPCDRAGFCPGDVIIEFDGKPVESMEELIETMPDKVEGPVKVLVKRANDELVTLIMNLEETRDV